MEIDLAPRPKSKTAVPPIIPTPPAEVFIRTMESDIRSLRESGGLGVRPKPERVTVAGVAAEARAPRPSFFAGRNFQMRWLVIAGVAAIGAVAVLVFLFTKFSFSPVSNEEMGSDESSAPFASGDIPAAGGAAGGNEAAPAVSEGGTETSQRSRDILRNPADQTIPFIAAGAVGNEMDLKTPSQRLQEALAGARRGAAFIEVVPQDANGARVGLRDAIPLFDIAVLAPSFLTTHFEEKFVMFVYRDARGWWPGYIFALKPGENWLFLKGEAAVIEESPRIADLYFTPPGEPKRGFHNASVGAMSARTLEWQSPAGKAGAPFAYGWFRGYLIISTSEAGLAALVPRL